MDRESVEREHAQLKREAALERGRVSESANTLKNYIQGEPDPLVDGIAKRDNPYIKKGGCTIL